MMEKSGKILLTSQELDDINSGKELPYLLAQWGFTNMQELKEVINSGQYEITNITSNNHKD